MRSAVVRMLVVAACLAAIAGCRKPEPPPTEQPVEPQAKAAVETDATELRDAIREPIERAEAVEGDVLDAAEKQRDAIDAATGG